MPYVLPLVIMMIYFKSNEIMFQCYLQEDPRSDLILIFNPIKFDLATPSKKMLSNFYHLQETMDIHEGVDIFPSSFVGEAMHIHEGIDLMLGSFTGEIRDYARFIACQLMVGMMRRGN
jgi:hypothetical protein